jgi:hypothetical protein
VFVRVILEIIGSETATAWRTPTLNVSGTVQQTRSLEGQENKENALQYRLTLLLPRHHEVTSFLC